MIYRNLIGLRNQEDNMSFHDNKITCLVTKIFRNPLTRDKYETLKARIISSFDKFSESKLRALLRNNEFLDEKPFSITLKKSSGWVM